MLIAATSSSSNPVVLNPVLRTQPGSQASGSSSVKSSRSSSPAVSSQTSSGATGASSPAASSSGGHTRVSGGGGGDAAAAAAAEVETLVGSYATTVNGTQYAGSVEEENGAYPHRRVGVASAGYPVASILRRRCVYIYGPRNLANGSFSGPAGVAVDACLPCSENRSHKSASSTRRMPGTRLVGGSHTCPARRRGIYETGCRLV
jgi:hypothetical protein